MKEQIESIASEAMEKLENVQDMKSLEEIRGLFLGKKGRTHRYFKGGEWELFLQKKGLLWVKWLMR